MKVSIFKILFPLLFATILSYSQSQKRAVKVEDYHKWSSLQTAEISPNGNWLSYNLNYDYGADTLFVQHCKSGKKIAFPSGSAPVFSADSKWFASMDTQKRLSLLDLESGSLKTYANTRSHEFYASGNYWVVLRENGNSTDLLIYQYDTNTEQSITDVRDFTIANDGTIAVLRSQEVAIIDPARNFSLKTVTKEASTGYKKLYWSSNSKILSFFQELLDDKIKPPNHKVYWYNRADDKIKVLQSSEVDSLNSQRITLRRGVPALTFSADGKTIFISTTAGEQESKQQPYEIWNSQSPFEYTLNKYLGNEKKIPKLWMWTPKSGKLMSVGTKEYPNILFTANRKSALVFNSLKYEPQYEHYSPADFYIRDLVTGNTHLFLEKYSTAPGMMGGSPKGSYIHYFKDDNWWVYDISKNVHHNITKGLGLQLIDSSDQYPGVKLPYDSPGWSYDEKSLIIYDSTDVWLFSPDGKKNKRLTNGKNDKVRYRIDTTIYSESPTRNKENLPSQGFELSKGLVLEALGENMESGYFKWLPKLELKQLVYNKSGNSRLRKAANGESYIFIEQSATIPARLMMKSSEMIQSKVLFQSNEHTNNYQWGTAEIVKYQNKNGENLKGILYKPADYIVGKKYPLIVLVYEKVSYKFHDYYPPTEYSAMGFTPSNYFLDGYMVLLPDISFKIGSPGLSSADCIESAVNEIKKQNSVLENSIGIIGHSYGGCEVAFAISQSNTFAAAVAGSGIMNLIAGYFTYDSVISRSNAWRYESHQGRMGYTPFDNWESYEENSPLNHADKITTPLFTWAGRKDYNVLWKQSAELHMALRRLGKKNIFLVYDNESHIIHTSELQKDLTKKTKNWFDYYLKGKKSALTNGMP